MENINPDDQVVTMTIPTEDLNNLGTNISSVNVLSSQISQISTPNPQPEMKSPEEVSTITVMKTNPDVATGEGKSNAGRPCEYCEDQENILKITQEYINARKSLERPRMPYVGELAILLDRDDETITLWAKKINKENKLEHPEFSALIKKMKSIQHLRLQQRLLGRYNPTGSIMWLKTKFGYIETEKQILAGDKTEPLQIEIIEEKHDE